MKKIPLLFKRESARSGLVTPQVNSKCSWVSAGFGVATRKWDGTACLYKGGILYKRYKLRKGKTAPSLFLPAQDPDPHTGEIPGWVPILGGPEDKYHLEAYKGFNGEEGTYELVGPKINGNPEKFDKHVLIQHGKHLLFPQPPR